MSPGIIPYNSIPNWPSPPAGLFEACESAGISASRASDGVHVSNLTGAQNIISAYSGGATELSWNKTKKQVALDVLFDANFDLKAFIRAGSATNITATNIGTFLATITNNYRSLRASIAAAANVAAVNAININAGWPSNP